MLPRKRNCLKKKQRVAVRHYEGVMSHLSLENMAAKEKLQNTANVARSAVGRIAESEKEIQYFIHIKGCFVADKLIRT